MPIVFGGTVESVAKRLESYPKPALDALLAATGGAPGSSQKLSARAAADVLVAGAPVERLVAGLPPAAREIAYHLAVMPGRCHISTLEERMEGRASLTAAQVKQAIDILAKSGLVVATGTFGTVDTIPDLVRGVGESAAACLAGIRPDQARTLPISLVVAAVCAVVAEDPPPLTQGGRPHARWLRKFEARLAGPAASPQLVYRAYNAAAKLGVIEGLVEADVDGAVRQLLPCAGRLEQLTALPAVDLAFLVATSDAQTKIAAAVLARALAASGDNETDLSRVQVAADEFCALDWYAKVEFGNCRRMTLFAVADLLAAAEQAGIAELTRGDRITSIKRAQPSQDLARWTVLPNFRVLVPAETDPGALWQLAMIARLGRLDRVAEFSLDRQSVSRRTQYGLTKPALAILEARSAFEIPDVVRREVASWDLAGPAVTAYFGEVYIAQSPADAAALRAPALELREIAPGVFLADESAASKLRPALRKLGIAVKTDAGSRDGDDEFEHDGDRAADAGEQVRLLRAALDRAVKAKPVLGAMRDAAHATDTVASARAATAEEAAAASKRTVAAAQPADGQQAGSKRSRARKAAASRSPAPATLTAADLALRFPLVFHACADTPDLIRRACTLGMAELRQIARARSSLEIARLVHLNSVALGRSTEASRGDASQSGATVEPAQPAKPQTKAARADRAAASSAPASPPTSSSRSPPPAAPPAPAFRPVPAGELRRIIEAAAAAAADVTVIYTAKDSTPRTRTIVPLRVKDVRGVVWIEAIEPALGDSVASFRLDRMSAIQG